jgi:broad specificity phosphatase PhoE
MDANCSYWTMVDRVYLLRHGETEWTLSGQHTGNTDLSLTQSGQKEATLLGQSLEGIEFSHVISSPLIRVVQTATLAGLSKSMVIDPDLVEVNYGDYEGLTSKQIAKIDPDWSVFEKQAPSGEALDEMTQRADRIIDKVLGLEGSVAILSSGHFSRVIGCRWVQKELEFSKRLFLSTAAKSILGFEHANRVIKLWNSTEHLKNV